MRKLKRQALQRQFPKRPHKFAMRHKYKAGILPMTNGKYLDECITIYVKNGEELYCMKKEAEHRFNSIIPF